MKEWLVRWLTICALLSLCLLCLTLSVASGNTQLRSFFEVPGLFPHPAEPPEIGPSLSTACALQPEQQSTRSRRSLGSQNTLASQSTAPPPTSLERFRRWSHPTTVTQSSWSTVPPEKLVLIDPSNYGDRFWRDIDGKPANLNPLIVLHETVYSVSSAINFFQTPHSKESEQASYHTLIGRDGTIIYLVPPDKRAFGAGNSAFKGPQGLETVRTHPTLPPSVNNFAYHISLESPLDGNNRKPTHSGYTDAQYGSLAWLVAKTGVPATRITTHRAVDRSNSRMDPRSFDGRQFSLELSAYPKTQEIVIACDDPTRSAQPNNR